MSRVHWEVKVIRPKAKTYFSVDQALKAAQTLVDRGWAEEVQIEEVTRVKYGNQAREVVKVVRKS